MNFLRCDSCGKPLGEGALGRGEAVSRGPLLVCKACIMAESGGKTLPLNPPSGSAVAWKTHAANAGADDLETEPLAGAAPVSGESVRIELPGGQVYEGRISRSASGRLVMQGAKPAANSAGKPASSRQGDSSSVKKTPVSLPATQPAAAPSARMPSHRYQGDKVKPASGWKSPLFLVAAAILLLVLPAFLFALYGFVVTQQKQGDLDARERALNLRDREEADKKKPDNAGRGIEPPLATLEPRQFDNSPPVEPRRRDASLALELPPGTVEHLNAMELDIARPLVKRLQSPRRGERMLALMDVARVRAVSAAAAVRALLSSGDTAERMLAASVAGELGDQEARAALEGLASSDPSVDVQIAANRALGRITGQLRAIELEALSTDELRRLEASLIKSSESQAALDMVRRELSKRGG